MINDGHTTMMDHDTTTEHAAGVLARLIGEQPDLLSGLLERGDGIDVPFLVTDAEPGPGEHRVLYCNTAFADMCGYQREQIVGATPRLLQGPETDAAKAGDFVREVESRGHAGTVLLNYKADGTPYYVEIMAVRCPTPTALDVDAEEVFVAFERSLGDLERGEDGRLPRPYRLALLLENVMRRYLQRNYHRGMHPAQWSALRYFHLAGPNKRTLSDFARSHRTTMGTASTTVSTLVGKGFLIKRGFRGPIELTDEGRAVLKDDPLDEVADTLARLDETGSRWAEHILLDLADRMDANGEAQAEPQQAGQSRGR